MLFVKRIINILLLLLLLLLLFSIVNFMRPNRPIGLHKCYGFYNLKYQFVRRITLIFINSF
ncbi:MAG: hypothetical protein N7Q72_01420, partial [Spiroplasma sp. Tabriz.8]|nr:hypothetical protein [Candidatus Regiella insecticola]MCZ8631903.1 hypothetical protein [Spiroplasma sp. Tabriz.8]